MYTTRALSSKYRHYIKSLKKVKDISGLLKLSKNCEKYVSCLQSVITRKVNFQDRSEISKDSAKSMGSNKIINTILRNKYTPLAATPLALDISSKLDEVKPVLEETSTLTLKDGTNISSTTEFSPQSTILSESIPEPPPIPEIPPDTLLDQLSLVNALGEPTFASLGLGGYTPVGWAQSCFEYLHGTLGIPWWEAIIIGTLVIRICLFPLVIIAQRNAAKMNNHMPQLQALQLKMTEARQTGNQLEAARMSQEIMIFMKEKNVNPLKNMIVPLAQMPVFVSFFMALRQMANVPVDSLRTGGLWWFTDLTMPDQYFLMPIITSCTLWATIELGTDTAKLSNQNLQTMKYVLRALPLIILPFTVNFPGVILVYWTSTNFISLVQVGFLKIPTVREYFKIDALVQHNPETLPVKAKGFTEGIKDSWTNMKIVKELEDRRRLDDMKFRQAGRGPIIKTYKYDPTKQTEPSNSPIISAKKS